MKLLTLPLAPLAVALLPACHIHLDDGAFTVDGVRLDEEHEETLEILAWDAAGLSIDTPAGDVTVRRTDGATRVVATIHERYPGDGRLEYRDGRLLVETKSGSPGSLSDVQVWTSLPLPRLAISTGAGDVTVRDVEVDGDVTLSTGMGDLELSGSGRIGECVASTGLGDVELASLHCTVLVASTGMGDVRLESVESEAAEISTGMGDVDVSASRFDRVEASTGMGDVDLSDATYRSGDVSTGMGSVRRGARLPD